jgi:hypothetical protein
MADWELHLITQQHESIIPHIASQEDETLSQHDKVKIKKLSHSKSGAIHI